jgi:glycosyltransferase involved in cell wall biosynthesis
MSSTPVETFLENNLRFNTVILMNVVVSHPGSPPFVQHVVMGLHQRGVLRYFATAYLDHPDYWLSRSLKEAARLIKPRYVKELERRAFHDVPFDQVRTHPFRHILQTLSQKLLDRPLLTDWLWETSELDFDRWVARRLPTDADAVYTFEHAGLETIKEAQRNGALAFYEQPSQHHSFFTELHRKQQRKHPGIKNERSSLHTGPKAERRNRRRDRELALADWVHCNSTFTKKTLIDGGVSEEKIIVTPYGFPPVAAGEQRERERVVFLNAGTQNLRKGIHLLYQAWRELRFNEEEAELWLIGSMNLPEALRRDLPGRVQIQDSIPRSELMDLYRQASVFVLPSLADGFGMVISESMSRGLPVITTQHTGGPDIIDHEEDGFIIPPDDKEALKAQMQWCVDHRHRLPEIGAQAVETAKQWQWSDYRRALAEKAEQKVEESSRAFT